MSFRASIISFLIILAGVGALVVFGIFYIFPNSVENIVGKPLEEITGNITLEKIKKEVVSPPPLRATEEVAGSVLTRSGIVSQTNLARKENGLPPLTENAKLNAAALSKVEDMFDLQFFAHVSPTGEGAGDLAEKEGYRYIVIGENLALGNFKDDAAVVKAWMASAGHRANILNTRYKEIGVAARKGTFEGKTTWLAVQIFGLSISACPEPNTALKQTIESYDQQLQNLKSLLDQLRMEIESMRPKRGPAYEEKVDSYNALVDQYNALLAEVKEIVNRYNSQVTAFNACLVETQGP